MREIKFRAWDKQDKRMVYTDWNSFRNWYNESHVGKVVEPRGFVDEKTRMSEPMQFTGLHDKNGKEIWEGDVVGVENGSEGKQRAEISWNPEEASFALKRGTFGNGWKIYQWTQDEIEVLGNIYEHPHLQKES